ncbi:hypothetical protein M3Y95_00711600 [Aphelenchoides besseyi]|nr:hypothetical protein M3Y95_00711600 [Aphelenchoides besseyi]
MSSFQIVAGKFIDVPPIQRQITHAEAEAQTLPIDYRNASTSPLESTSRTTQTDRIIGTPLSARQLRISSVVLERIISELTKVEEENSIFAELDAFHSRRSVRLVQFRGAAVETTEHLSICGVVSGSERRVAVLCGERVHTSWCLHTGRVVVIYGSQRHWTHLGSCPTVATFGPHGQLIVGTANGEISVLLEGESLWSSTQMHLQAMTSLRWLSSHMLLSAALDGRIVLSSVQAGALEPVKSSSVSVSDLPRTMKRNNSSALKVGIVSTTVSSNELFVATDTGAILQVDADTLEAKPIGYEIEGIEQLEMSAGRFVAVSASNEAKILERNGLTVEWLGLRNVITMTHNGRNIFVFLTSDEVVIIDGNTLQVMLREPTTVLAVNFDDTGNLIGVMANEKNKNRNHDFSFSVCWFRLSEFS